MTAKNSCCYEIKRLLKEHFRKKVTIPEPQMTGHDFFRSLVTRRSDSFMFFIYDHEVLKKEEDDLIDAILYFYPPTVSKNDQCALCGQLMGMVGFFKSFTSATPKVFHLQTTMFVIRDVDQYTMGMSGEMGISECTLHQQLDRLYRTFTMFQGSIYALKQLHGEDHKSFLLQLQAVWDSYLPFGRHYGNVIQQTFCSIPRIDIPKTSSDLFLMASQVLQASQRRPGVLAGSILHKNRVLCTQLPPDITGRLLLIRPQQAHLPCQQVTTAFSLPVGVRILKVYLTHAEYESLLADRPRQTHCAVSQFTAKDMSNKLYAMRGSLLQNNTEFSMTKNSNLGDGDSSVNNDLSNIQTVGCLSGSTPSNRNVSKNISSIEQGQAEPKTSNTPSIKSTEDTFTNHKIKTIFDSGSGDEGNIVGMIVADVHAEDGDIIAAKNATESQNKDHLPQVSLDKDLSGDKSVVILQEEDESLVSYQDYSSLCDNSGMGDTEHMSFKVENIDEREENKNTNSNAKGSNNSVKLEHSGDEAQSETVCHEVDNSKDNTSGDNKNKKNEGINCDNQNVSERRDSVGDQIITINETIESIKFMDTDSNRKTDTNPEVTEKKHFSKTSDDNALNISAIEILKQSISDVESQTVNIDSVSVINEIQEANMTSTNITSFDEKETNIVSSVEEIGVSSKTSSESRMSGSVDTTSSADSKHEVLSFKADKNLKENRTDDSTPNKFYNANDSKTSEKHRSQQHQNTEAQSRKDKHSNGELASDVSLKEMTLYVQGHSEMVLLLLMENTAQKNEKIIHALWRSALPDLGDLDFRVKEALDAASHGEKHNDYGYLTYDSAQHLLGGNMLDPISSTENEFVDMSFKMHEEFNISPHSSDVILRNHKTCAHGHRILNNQTFFQSYNQTLTSAGMPFPMDSTFTVDQVAQQKLLKNHGITIL